MKLKTLSWFGVMMAVCGVSILSAQQMQTRGELAITDDGTAALTIPLLLPPAPGNNDPALSLVYKSRSGNGLFGVGWTLSGLPSITRCSKNIAEEGARVGVKNDSSDLFCLGGEKLRLVSGVYGGDGAQYKSAREGYSRIVSYGTLGAGPRWFRVEQKDGQILEFGNTEDSRLDMSSSPTVRVWMVNTISDRSTNGNPQRFTYQKNNAIGEQMLTTLQFANGFLEIEYETRPSDDQILLFDAGVQFGSTAKRGKTIRIYSEPLVGGVPNRQLFKEYRLAYAQSGATRRSLLSFVTECSPGGACLPSVQLKYGNTSLASVQFSATGAPSAQTHAIDVKGNGKLSLLQMQVLGAPPAFLGAMSGEYVGSLAVWDHNGDGLPDIEFGLDKYNRSTRWVVSLSNGTTFGPAQELGDQYWCHGDFDGDGRTDAIAKTLGGTYQAPTLMLGTWSGGAFAVRPLSVATAGADVLKNAVLNYGQCDVADFDGDGRSELLVTEGSGILGYSFAFNGAAASANQVFGWDVGGNPHPSVTFGDFNGDGKTDYVRSQMAANLGLSLSTGGSFNFVKLPDSIQSPSLQNGCIGDFNGDGRSDTYDRATGDFLLSISTGFVRVPSGMGRDSAGATLPRLCGDFDGDGKADVYCIRPAKSS